MIEVRNLTIEYNEVLFQNQDISIKDKALTVLIGESGCGKTSLLYYIGLLGRRHKGKLIINRIDTDELSEKEKTIIRRNTIGFVFQEYMLPDHFTVYENLEYYASIAGKTMNEKKAEDLLRSVRLELEPDRKLYTLSGGQKQRLAVACAICKDPDILILDEPTSALDEENTRILCEVLSELKKERTVIVSSHDQSVLDYADEIIEIRDRKIRKIRECRNENEMIGTYNYVNHLSYSFYRNYIKRFRDKVRMQISLIRLVIISALLLNLFTLNITDMLIDDVKGSINRENPGQVFIRTDREIEQSLLDNEHIISEYRYYDAYIDINHNSYPVIPYYRENSLNQKIWTRFTQRQEMYLSYDLYNEVSFIVVPNSELDYEITIGRHKTEKEFLYTGILNKGMEATYIEDCQMFAYLPNELIESLDMDKESSGYTLFMDDYDYIVEFCSRMESLGYEISYSFNQFASLQNYIDTLNTVKIIMTVVIIIASAVLLNFVYRSYFNARRKEFALLKSNGMMNREIVSIVSLEFIKEYAIICLIIIAVMIMVCLASGLSIIENMILLGILTIFIILLLIIMIYIMVRNINIEKVFRDS